MQQKEPPRDLPKANIQTFVKAKLTRNFNLNTKNQAIKATKTNYATGITKTTNATKFFGATIDTKTTGMFLILKEINQLLLESKHTLTLGQNFKIALNLKQYIDAKLVHGGKTIIGPNLVIALMTIDPHMDVIQV
jgi:hypothetical protein